MYIQLNFTAEVIHNIRSPTDTYPNKKIVSVYNSVKFHIV